MIVSIIVPVYNRAQLIELTLKSIQAQKYANIECIVVDDGSTDNTKAIVNAFVRMDKRFVLLDNNRSKGPQGARNSGLLSAKGTYISFFDSDDLMHPEKFSRQVQYLNENPDCDICTCFSHIVNDDNEIIGAFKWRHSGNIQADLLSGETYVDQNSPLIRRTALERIGLLDENCPSFQEWDTHIRLAKDSRYGMIEDFLVTYFQRSSGRISTDKQKELLGLSYIYNKHRDLWKELVGENKYYSNIYTLFLKLPEDNSSLRKEVQEILPDLSLIQWQIKLLVRIRHIGNSLHKFIRHNLLYIFQITNKKIFQKLNFKYSIYDKGNQK